MGIKGEKMLQINAKQVVREAKGCCGTEREANRHLLTESKASSTVGDARALISKGSRITPLTSTF
jgi:hypothetical protein